MNQELLVFKSKLLTTKLCVQLHMPRQLLYIDYEFIVLNVIKLDKVSTNLRDLLCNLFKIGLHFKELLLKETVHNIFLKMFLFSDVFCVLSTNFKGHNIWLQNDIWIISQTENTTENCGHGFLLLFIIINWSRKKKSLPLVVKVECW